MTEHRKFLGALTALLFAAAAQALVLNVGYEQSPLNKFSKKEMKIATDVLLQEILKDIPVELSLKLYETPEAIAEAVERGNLDLVYAYGLEFVEHFDLAKLEDGFTNSIDESKKMDLVVVVSADREIADWKALEGGGIVYQQDDHIAEIYARTAIARAGGKAVRLLSESSRQRCLLQLFFGKADAAIVPYRSFELAVELNPQMGKRLKVLERTDLSMNTFGFFRRGFDPESRDTILKIGLALHEMPRGKQLLTVYRTDRLIRCSLEDLEPIRKLLEAYRKLYKKEQP